MEKSFACQIEKNQFENRLCATFLRLNWLIAAAAAVPVIFTLIELTFAMAAVLYYLILIAVTILSLFLLLLNEDFRALYLRNGMDGITSVTEKIYGVYSTVMPVLLSISAVILLITVYLSVKGERKFRTKRIVSAVLSVVFAVFFSVAFFISGR